MGDSLGDLVRDVVEVRRGAANHGPQRDHRVDLVAVGEARARERDFPRSWHAHDRDFAHVGAVTAKRVDRAFDQTFHDEAIEAGGHDGKARSFRDDQRAFEGFGELFGRCHGVS